MAAAPARSASAGITSEAAPVSGTSGVPAVVAFAAVVAEVLLLGSAVCV